MHPGRRPSARKTLAVAVFCLAASFLAAPVPAEARAVSAGQGPQQVMDIPPADPDYSTSISILGAGQTGMLMEQASLPGDWWTDYSTGATTQVPTLPATVSSMQSMGATGPRSGVQTERCTSALRRWVTGRTLPFQLVPRGWRTPLPRP